jgi:L-fucose isomerase-like protein
MADVQTRGIPLTEAVLLRPAMYTMNGTFAEVVAFLEGYFSGMAHGNPNASPVVEWSDFEQWLVDRMKVDGAELFRKIEQAHSEDCERLRALADLFARFRAERQ